MVEELSAKLKEQTYNKYKNGNIAWSKQVVNREDFVVDLSLIRSVLTSNEDDGHSDEYYIPQSIPFQDIVKSSSDFVYIMGEPGSGKTTLLQTLLYAWSKNELWCGNAGEPRFDFVYILYLKELVEFENDKDASAEKILASIYPEYVLGQPNTLLMLDGFDQLYGKEQFQQSTDLFTPYVRACYDLLDPNNTQLTCKRMVTYSYGLILYETVMSQMLRSERHVVEVLGFTERNLCSYLRKRLPESDTTELVKEIRSKSPKVDELMTVPFFCCGISSLFEAGMSVELIGPTKSALYTQLLTLLLSNGDVINNDEQFLLMDTTLQKSSFKESCLCLSQLSYNLQVTGKLIFAQSDLPDKIGIRIEDLSRRSGGLVFEIQQKTCNGSLTPNTKYQFSHYCFQEFLVALHMFVNGTVNVEKAMKNFPTSDGQALRAELENILPLLAGLIGGTLPDSKSPSIIKQFSEVFRTEASGDLTFDDLISNMRETVSGEISNTTELSDYVLEYANPVNSQIMTKNISASIQKT